MPDQKSTKTKEAAILTQLPLFSIVFPQKRCTYAKLCTDRKTKPLLCDLSERSSQYDVRGEEIGFYLAREENIRYEPANN